MHPNLPKYVELFIHFIAVAVIVVIGVRSYELTNFMVYEGYTVISDTAQDTTKLNSFTIRGYSSSAKKDSTQIKAKKPAVKDSIPTDVVTIEGIRYNVLRASSDQVLRYTIEYALFIISWFVAYFFLFKKYHKSLKKKLFALATSWLGFSILHMGILITVMVLLKSPDASQPSVKVLSFGTFSAITESPVAFYFLIVFLAFLAQTTVQFLYRYQELEQADHVQSELALIRSQLRPHFFFNTLNNLYSMALESNNETLAEGLQNLTSLMRYSLKHSTKEWVSVQDEWEYIHTYVELQKLRIDPALVDIQIQHTGNLKIPKIAPMVLINFVENAFKHGVSYASPSHIDIRLTVEDARIHLMVENSNNPSKQEQGSSGIGTSQTKKLLKLYYENDYTLDVTSNEQIYILKLSVPTR